MRVLRQFRTGILLTVFLITLLLIPHRAYSSEALKTNPDTGFGIWIEDDADLLSDEEEKELISHMEPVTAYGNAGFISTSEYIGNTGNYAADKYREMFGRDSGSLFIIDMYNRYLYIQSNGYLYSVVTDSYAETITDNVYRLASKGEYASCAGKAFDQMSDILNGQKIARPMKHITNLLLSVAASMAICYLLVRFSRRRVKPANKEILRTLRITGEGFTNPVIKSAGVTKTHSPRKSSSGGDGFSGGGGGFSGGGGGGGGGHGF